MTEEVVDWSSDEESKVLPANFQHSQTASADYLVNLGSRDGK